MAPLIATPVGVALTFYFYFLSVHRILPPLFLFVIFVKIMDVQSNLHDSPIYTINFMGHEVIDKMGKTFSG